MPLELPTLGEIAAFLTWLASEIASTVAALCRVASCSISCLSAHEPATSRPVPSPHLATRPCSMSRKAKPTSTMRTVLLNI